MRNQKIELKGVVLWYNSWKGYGELSGPQGERFMFLGAELPRDWSQALASRELVVFSRLPREMFGLTVAKVDSRTKMQREFTFELSQEARND